MTFCRLVLRCPTLNLKASNFRLHRFLSVQQLWSPPYDMNINGCTSTGTSSWSRMYLAFGFVSSQETEAHNLTSHWRKERCSPWRKWSSLFSESNVLTYSQAHWVYAAGTCDFPIVSVTLGLITIMNLDTRADNSNNRTTKYACHICS